MGKILAEDTILVNDEKKYEVQVNKNGQTYGSNLATKEYGNEPDLILVEADNGKIGYVYKEDFYDTYNQPKNPEEAVEYMKRLKEKDNRIISVYTEDGKKQIGVFTITNH